jgi:hypothetical protein
MILEWFNAKQATEVGNALAEEFVRQTASSPSKRRKKTRAEENHAELQSFIQRIDSEARPLRLNLYKRAKLANSFKWKLLQNGFEQPIADELTRMLLLRLAGR